VHEVLRHLRATPLPSPLVTELVRTAIGNHRQGEISAPQLETIVAETERAMADAESQRLMPVINATGVILHTNLGRAPLSAAAQQAVHAAMGYTNLEYDLDEGRRGRRGLYPERLLALLAGAQAALVVNNCAAALVLLLHHVCRPRRRDVLISRGELVQIGGGFRVPEILHAAHARLREVGTTNHTTLDDYAAALSPKTAAILRVHRSNFFQEGFTHTAPRRELAALATRHNLPLLEDLGSGNLHAATPEITPAQAHREGASLVCFSGDKLFGGPQAGIITGSRAQIDALRRTPLFRALRPDKLALAALQATAEAHLADSAIPRVPVLEMLHASPGDVAARAQALMARILALNLPLTLCVVPTEAQTGGGALPRARIPSSAIALSSHDMRPEQLAARLRRAVPPVIATISRDHVLLDLRTILPEQENALIQAVAAAARGGAP
jgi:L-seryl-tRNA(Ser) seleniumtransferase